MKVVAAYNLKGGVGKSTTAVNLACLAGREGAPTLLWDLDPQGAAGYYLGLPPDEGGGSARIVRGTLLLHQLIVHTRFARLDLIPSRFSYRRLDQHLSARAHPKKVLAQLLAPLAHSYEWIFLDCPPGISLLAESIFRAADVLLIPVIPTPLSLRTFEEIAVFTQRKGVPRRKLVPFFSMVERRKRIHRETMAAFTARETGVRSASIPSLSAIERMAVTRRPVAWYRPQSEAGRAYAALWKEVKAAIEGSAP